MPHIQNLRTHPPRLLVRHPPKLPARNILALPRAMHVPVLLHPTLEPERLKPLANIQHPRRATRRQTVLAKRFRASLAREEQPAGGGARLVAVTAAVVRAGAEVRGGDATRADGVHCNGADWAQDELAAIAADLAKVLVVVGFGFALGRGVGGAEGPAKKLALERGGLAIFKAVVIAGEHRDGDVAVAGALPVDHHNTVLAFAFLGDLGGGGSPGVAYVAERLWEIRLGPAFFAFALVADGFEIDAPELGRRRQVAVYFEILHIVGHSALELAQRELLIAITVGDCGNVVVGR
mmetsp:Transcript_7866/g.19546  ORF Transcript_7866/g.19546 Transcript_7866/m.19546 type:complete len:293 (+) Transcript_7866:376-1254(+)